MRSIESGAHVICVMNGQPARRVTDLVVWRLAHELTLGVYQMTGTFPKWELYALGDQMRRASVSVPANIAEGFRKRTQREKLRYLNIAEASLEELKYYLLLAQDLGYAKTQELTQLAGRVELYIARYAGAIRGKAEAA